MTSPDPLTVLYDADCGFCSHTAAVLRRLDHARRLRLVALQVAGTSLTGAPSEKELLAVMHVVDRAGRWSRGGAAWLRIASKIPMLRPLAVVGGLPLINRGVERLYGLVACNRGRLSRQLGLDRCTHRGVGMDYSRRA